MLVLISRTDNGFRFSATQPGDAHLIGFNSRGISLAVTEADAGHFRGSVLSSHYDALFRQELWWLENPNERGHSGCSDPLGASCSRVKFRELHPELFGLAGLLARFRGGVAREDREQLIARTSAYLRWGDARAAVVVRLTPLVVAAYCDEMDAAILLGFPGSFVARYSLKLFTPLVTANLHFRAPDGQVAADITRGPNYLGRFTNVRPLIADFLAAEEELVQARWKAIATDEYVRCRSMGEAALRRGQAVRAGRPLEAGRAG